MRILIITFIVSILINIKGHVLAQCVQMVKDVTPGNFSDGTPKGSRPRNMCNYEDKLIFEAITDVGAELWTSNGCMLGTTSIQVVWHGAFGHRTSPKIPFNGMLAFHVGPDPISTTERWLMVTDGTTDGTTPIKNFGIGTAIKGFANVNGTIYISVDAGTYGEELWKSDGTTGGTILVKDINNLGSSDPRSLTELNGILYFSASDGTNGRELWRSDGTESGTYMVKNINPSTGSSLQNLNSIIAINDLLFFQADDGTLGQELWRSDGTDSGTFMIKDINPSGDAAPGGFTEFNSKLFFIADDGTNGREPWISDGTANGTYMIRDINLNGSSFPSDFIIFNDQLLFRATDGSGSELWSTNGSINGTHRIRDINPSGSANPQGFVVVDDKVFFTADDGSHGRELWQSDGTQLGTEMVLDINPNGSMGLSKLFVVHNKIVFGANDGINGTELWESDGTASGTKMVMDINPTGSSRPSNFTLSNNILFFSANDGIFGEELWKYDLSAPAINQIPSIEACNNFVLPEIQGSNLSGNEAYYTGPEGTGMKLMPGDIISTNTILYAFDSARCCETDQIVDITILPSNSIYKLNGAPPDRFWSKDTGWDPQKPAECDDVIISSDAGECIVDEPAFCKTIQIDLGVTFEIPLGFTICVGDP